MPLMNSSVRSLLYSFVLAVALAFAAAPARAGSPVVWTLSVPPPTGASTSSTLDSITSDSAGDAFVVIALSDTFFVGSTPITTPSGSQLFLLNPKGKIVGAVEVSSTVIKPLYVSSKRVIVADSTGLVEFTPNSGGALVSTNLSTQTQGETLVPSEPLNQDFKYLHTTLSSNGFISTVKRYLVTKLVP
jgi:hypothetical protein